MGSAERTKDVSDTDWAAYAQGVGIDINADIVKVRDINLDPTGKFSEENCKTAPTICG